VTRDLGPDVLGKLRENPSIDVRHLHSLPGRRKVDITADILQLVVWPQDCGCDRKWLLEKVEGATGVVVMLTDKVDCTKNAQPTNRNQDLTC